ncbi:hypothetical protein TSUD_92130 [Trifolium subterraneum]|uniref:Uncharacterized protein n=1 Tax=Trifolium subterraneum TaxID=3900 RepID=A0A2Z6N815_TRISU|nr:hypothetical protein TSUD_92130 [Trifolium subterraneum]
MVQQTHPTTFQLQNPWMLICWFKMKSIHLQKDLDFEPQQLPQDLDSSPVVAKHNDNKFQPYELITKGRKSSAIVDTVPAVVAEQKEHVTTVEFTTFPPTSVLPLLMKTAMNTISTAPPQHLVPSFDPGGSYAKQESSLTHPFQSQPSKPPYCCFATMLSPSFGSS